MMKDKDSIENLREQIALLYLIKSKALHYLPTFIRTESLPRHSGHTSLRTGKGHTQAKSLCHVSVTADKHEAWFDYTPDRDSVSVYI